MGRPFPLKIVPSHGGCWPTSNTWFLGPTRVLNPNGISIGSAVFAGLTTVTDRETDRPTDHATWSVTVGSIYITFVYLEWQSITFYVYKFLNVTFFHFPQICKCLTTLQKCVKNNKQWVHRILISLWNVLLTTDMNRHVCWYVDANVIAALLTYSQCWCRLVTQFLIILLNDLSFPSPNDIIRPCPLTPSALCSMS